MSRTALVSLVALVCVSCGRHDASHAPMSTAPASHTSAGASSAPLSLDHLNYGPMGQTVPGCTALSVATLRQVGYTFDTVIETPASTFTRDACFFSTGPFRTSNPSFTYRSIPPDDLEAKSVVSDASDYHYSPVPSAGARAFLLPSLAGLQIVSGWCIKSDGSFVQLQDWGPVDVQVAREHLAAVLQNVCNSTAARNSTAPASG